MNLSEVKRDSVTLNTNGYTWTPEALRELAKEMSLVADVLEENK